MLERAIKRCLAKEPDDRCRQHADLELELKWLAEGGSQTSLAPADLTRDIRARWRGALLWGAVSLLLADITSFVIWNLKPSPLPPPVSRMVISCRRSASCRTRSTRRGSFARRRSCRLCLPSKAPHSRFICGRWTAWMPGPFPARKQLPRLSSHRRPMAGILRGQQTEKGLSERGRGAHSWRCCVPWRGQLGRGE